MIKVYIASPYTLGDVGQNVHNAMVAADSLIDLGFAPFVPLYSHFQHIRFPRPYKTWVQLDLEWLRYCDCLLRLPGKSRGADKEVCLAIERNIPVFQTISKIARHYGVQI